MTTQIMERETSGQQLAEEVKSLVVEKMRVAIAQKDWKQLALLIDTFASVAK